jgi:outer membrane protein assembly factor BamD
VFVRLAPKIFVYPLFLVIAISVGCSTFGKKQEEDPEDKAPFNAKSYMEQAETRINEGDLYDAQQLLEDVAAMDATKQYEPLARIRIADIHYEKNEFVAANEQYKKFLEMYEHHEYAPYVQFRYAMSYLKQVDEVDTGYELTKEALDEFRKLQTQFPRNPYMAETEERIQMCLNMLAEHELYVGTFYYKKGSYQAASLRFQELLRNYPPVKNESEVLLMLGTAYVKLNEKHRAVETLRTVIHKYPHSEEAEKAEKMIADMME